MGFPHYISHYFEKEAGPLLSICDLSPEKRQEMIRREETAETGFNRFAYGEAFFDFRILADDLLVDLYENKFDKSPDRRPYYGVLGDADVVGGLFRDPQKIRIPMDHFEEEEVTFMVPDHFHLVGLKEEFAGNRMFGFQPPDDYSESKYPYFGKLLTYVELVENFSHLKIDRFLDQQRQNNGWYRYVEAQIWSDPGTIRTSFGRSTEVWPESWTHNGVTHLQNYKRPMQTD